MVIGIVVMTGGVVMLLGGEGVTIGVLEGATMTTGEMGFVLVVGELTISGSETGVLGGLFLKSCVVSDTLDV